MMTRNAQQWKTDIQEILPVCKLHEWRQIKIISRSTPITKQTEQAITKSDMTSYQPVDQIPETM